MAGDGDVDGDGVADAAVTAYANSSYKGTGYIIYGGATSDLSSSSSDIRITGSNTSDYCGYGAQSINMGGDLNDDGYDDIALGCPYTDVNGSASGTVAILFGSSSLSSTYTLATVDATFEGEAASNYLGRASAILPDVNGDGIDDLAMGTSYASSSSGGGTTKTSTGAAYLVYGDVSSGSYDVSTDADAKIGGESTSDYFGWSLSSAGDYDADGVNDFIIGAYGEDSGANTAGATYLFLGGGL